MKIRHKCKINRHMSQFYSMMNSHRNQSSLLQHSDMLQMIGCSGGLKFGSVHISGIFTDDAFTFVACMCSQRKRTYVLTDMRVKRSCFLEWREVPEL